MKKIQVNEMHNSMRGYFAGHLYNAMIDNPNIWLITADLGFGLWDNIREDFPDRFINTGASEQSAMGIAVGLALEKKIPFIYSITPFLLWRPAETIRLYLEHENIPVKLIGSGRDTDYALDGYSHNATDAYTVFKHVWPNIKTYWPNHKDEIQCTLNNIISNDKPSFLSLKR